MIWFIKYDIKNDQDTLEEPVKKKVSTTWNCLSGNTHPISQEFCQCIQKNPIFLPVISQK